MPAKLQCIEGHHDVFDGPVWLLDEFVDFRVRSEVNNQVDIVGIVDMADAFVEIAVGGAQILEKSFDAVGPGVGPDIDAKHIVAVI
jgi:hypothetical protein